MSGLIAPVTQEAREAAAAWAKLNSRSQQAANILRGSCDTAPIVQAFAVFERTILARQQSGRTEVHEKDIIFCPQCEGEGGYPDGLDEAACHTDCTRCDGSGWIVDLAALGQGK